MMEALAPAPPTFRLAPRPYQYEAVAALLAATASHETRDLVLDAMALLTALSTATTGSHALRQGSLALLRCCREGCSWQAVAHAWGIPAGTLRSHVHATRRYLTTQLGLR
jgi:hypothetical protein